MTVVPTEYLKSHPATKQEAQLKYYLEYDNMSPKILGYIKIKSDELEDNSSLLNTKIKSLIAYQDCDKLHMDRLSLNYRYNISYNYLNEIIFEMKCPFFRLNDIKHNRTRTFKYYTSEFKKISDRRVDRTYNVVTWSISGKMGRQNSSFIVPFVISEITLTKKLTLMSYRGDLLRIEHDSE